MDNEKKAELNEDEMKDQEDDEESALIQELITRTRKLTISMSDITVTRASDHASQFLPTLVPVINPTPQGHHAILLKAHPAPNVVSTNVPKVDSDPDHTPVAALKKPVSKHSISIPGLPPARIILPTNVSTDSDGASGSKVTADIIDMEIDETSQSTTKNTIESSQLKTAPPKNTDTAGRSSSPVNNDDNQTLEKKKDPIPPPANLNSSLCAEFKGSKRSFDDIEYSEDEDVAEYGLKRVRTEDDETPKNDESSADPIPTQKYTIVKSPWNNDSDDEVWDDCSSTIDNSDFSGSDLEGQVTFTDDEDSRDYMSLGSSYCSKEQNKTLVVLDEDTRDMSLCSSYHGPKQDKTVVKDEDTRDVSLMSLCSSYHGEDHKKTAVVKNGDTEDVSLMSICSSYHEDNEKTVVDKNKDKDANNKKNDEEKTVVEKNKDEDANNKKNDEEKTVVEKNKDEDANNKKNKEDEK